MGSDAKVGEVDLVVGNDGGSSEVVVNDGGLSEEVGNEGRPSEAVDSVVVKNGGPSEAVDVEVRRDGILSLVVGSIVDVKLATAVD